jgi:hypothetical protein
VIRGGMGGGSGVARGLDEKESEEAESYRGRRKGGQRGGIMG